MIAADAVGEDGLPSDVLRTGVIPAKPNNDCDNVYIQPEDSGDPEQNKRNMKACVESCMKFGYTMQVQMHKIAGIV